MTTVRFCKTEAEAQALAGFLWNEKQRHLKDVAEIDKDLAMLRELWNIEPREIREFVKP